MATKIYTLTISVESKGENAENVATMVQHFEEDVAAAATRNLGQAEIRLVSLVLQ